MIACLIRQDFFIISKKVALSLTIYIRYLTLKKSVKMFTTENIFKSEQLYQKRNYDILE